MSLHIAKSLRLRSAVLVSLSALPIAVHAAQVITLDDAIGIALERNVPLLQARTTAQLSDVAVSAAKLTSQASKLDLSRAQETPRSGTTTPASD
jgi:hypothetical protein